MIIGACWSYWIQRLLCLDAETADGIWGPNYINPNKLENIDFLCVSFFILLCHAYFSNPLGKELNKEKKGTGFAISTY